MIDRSGFDFESVSFIVDEQAIIDDVCIELAGDGITVIAGPSGAGKSTLLRLCNRLEAPTSGRVLLNGVDTATIPPMELRRRAGMVFQRPVPLGGSMRENLVVADPQLSDERAVAIVERVGLEPAVLDRGADDLSGGEAQRMRLARTLLTRPEVLLMDEPTSALDPDSCGQIEQLARSLADDGTPVLWVSHDLEQIARIADRTVVLIAGRLATEPAADRFLSGGHHEKDET